MPVWCLAHHIKEQPMKYDVLKNPNYAEESYRRDRGNMLARYEKEYDL